MDKIEDGFIREIIENLGLMGFTFNLGKFKNLVYKRAWEIEILSFSETKTRTPLCICELQVEKLNIDFKTLECNIIEREEIK